MNRPDLPFGIEMEETELMSHRYLYYVLGTPIIPDREYDRRERLFLEVIKDMEGSQNSPLHDTGSDRAESYTLEQVSLATALKEAQGCD